MDNGGRYFYINEGGNVWSPTWKPCKTALDSYECRHGMSYTRITGSKDGIEASLLFFVPLKTWGEVQKLTLRNTSAKVRKLKLFSFAEWCLWNAATDMENFQRNFSTGEVEVDGSVIYHKTEYKERRNHYAFYSVNTPVDVSIPTAKHSWDSTTSLPTGTGSRRQTGQQHCPRLESHRLALSGSRTATRRKPRLHLPAGLCGKQAGGKVRGT